MFRSLALSDVPDPPRYHHGLVQLGEPTQLAAEGQIRAQDEPEVGRALQFCPRSHEVQQQPPQPAALGLHVPVS